MEIVEPIRTAVRRTERSKESSGERERMKETDKKGAMSVGTAGMWPKRRQHQTVGLQWGRVRIKLAYKRKDGHTTHSKVAKQAFDKRFD